MPITARLSDETVMEHSWTDDLPVCSLSGTGHATNSTYRHTGHHLQRDEYEDVSLRTWYEKTGIYLYSIFDGHDGKYVADYATQKLPAELLFGQINSSSTDHDVREALKQAFESIESGYFSSIDTLLAKKETIMCQIKGLNEREASERFPQDVYTLKTINDRVSSGATAVVALILRDQLFIANVGDCRALLCRTDVNGGLRVIQVGVQHDVENADERLRLTQLGLSEKSIRIFGHPTRCLGDYPRKGGYREIENLMLATDEPVISEPDIYQMQLNDSSQFLILMSAGAVSAMEDALGTKKINGQIAQWIAIEFAQQTSLNGVAQAVVDKISRHHHEAFLHSESDTSFLCQHREDMTIIVRNINYRPLDGTGDTIADSQASSVDSVATRQGKPLPLDSEGRIPAYVDFSGFFAATKTA